MGEKKRTAGGWAARTEGWQAGVVAIAVAGLGLLFGAPRSVPPQEVPLPVARPDGLRAAAELEKARAVRLARSTEREREELFDVRVLGDLLRRYGEADVAKNRDDLARIRPEIVQVIRGLHEDGKDEAILALRAYQLATFLRGLSRWENDGEVDAEGRAVGGDFTPIAEANGWVDERGRLRMNDVVRAALFKRRFSEITGWNDPRFALSLDEMRELYAFWLSTPPRTRSKTPDPPRQTLEWQLAKVSEIAAVDPDYPGDFAKGVVHYRLGDAREAVKDFGAHLAKHPDGPWTLRARNHLVAALEAGGT